MRGSTWRIAPAVRAAAVIYALSSAPALARGQAAPPPPASAVDPEAVAALTKMSAYLRTLKAFQVRAATSRDDLLPDGQRVQFNTVADMLARRPDRLRVEVTGDEQRFYLYDGKEFTVSSAPLGYYATVPAPSTLALLADRLEERYGIELPVADLFEWGTDREHTSDIKGATDLGPSVVEGTTCEHYAFRQAGLDWQVWIQLGDYPLPRKLVLITLTDEARPQYSAVLTWNLAPSFNEAAFTFDPAPDAHRIVLADVSAPATTPKK